MILDHLTTFGYSFHYEIESVEASRLLPAETNRCPPPRQEHRKKNSTIWTLNSSVILTSKKYFFFKYAFS